MWSGEFERHILVAEKDLTKACESLLGSDLSGCLFFTGHRHGMTCTKIEVKKRQNGMALICAEYGFSEASPCFVAKGN